MGYALRHVADLRTSFEEMGRVLRADGKVVILEITAPKGRVSRALVKFYMKQIVPPASMLVTRSLKARQLMRYYWDSIEQCVDPEVILKAMDEAGLREPKRETAMNGFLTEYIATAP
jgi:demethylmenaquinone methyltransferase / 2-methoxy-6-polyprenyl-1,4-benzoquinol methylase